MPRHTAMLPSPATRERVARSAGRGPLQHSDKVLMTAKYKEPPMNRTAGIAVDPITASDAEIAAALEHASVPCLLMSMIHMSGDTSLLDGPNRPQFCFLNDVQCAMTPEQQAAVRAQALEIVRAYRDRGCTPAARVGMVISAAAGAKQARCGRPSPGASRHPLPRGGRGQYILPLSRVRERMPRRGR